MRRLKVDDSAENLLKDIGASVENMLKEDAENERQREASLSASAPEGSAFRAQSISIVESEKLKEVENSSSRHVCENVDTQQSAARELQGAYLGMTYVICSS